MNTININEKDDSFEIPEKYRGTNYTIRMPYLTITRRGRSSTYNSLPPWDKRKTYVPVDEIHFVQKGNVEVYKITRIKTVSDGEKKI